MKQQWKCDDCGKGGAVPYTKHDGVFAMLSKLSQAHRAKSPECHDRIALEFVRVGNSTAVRESESHE